MTTRRHTILTLAALAAAGLPRLAVAVQRQSLSDPLRVAADDALTDSGLAGALQRSFSLDTGIAVQLLRGPASRVLEALEHGEHDAAITNAPGIELPLEKQGLLHDRKPVGRSEFVLVGPAVLAKPLAAGKDVVLALSRLAQAQTPFLSRHDGSGTHLAELAAWRAAQIAPAAPWYRQAQAGVAVLSQAREQKACTLVERGAWEAQARSRDYGVLADGDPRLMVDVHVMRTFRAQRQHPAGKLFVAWITGPKGRRIVAAHRGYHSAP
jgi:tungstate transport system substrate-binding protein